jgi:hypothetical protein
VLRGSNTDDTNWWSTWGVNTNALMIEKNRLGENNISFRFRQVSIALGSPGLSDAEIELIASRGPYASLQDLNLPGIIRVYGDLVINTTSLPNELDTNTNALDLTNATLSGEYNIGL